MTFFIDWENWEQLTFILAVAIVFVFLAGFYKLWWTSRYIAKHEKEDEEKQAQINILRQVGIHEESNVPFGVRAIESGIEVDGIWISRSNSPLPSPTLKVPTTLYRSSGSSNTSTETDRHNSVSSNLSEASTISQQPTQNSPPDNSNGYSLLPKPMLGQSFDVAVPRDSPAEGPSPNQYATYKPRHSSALRYSSYGDTSYDAETLGHLEGATTPRKGRRLVKTRKPKGMPQIETQRQRELVAQQLAADSQQNTGLERSSPPESSSATTSLQSSGSPTSGDSHVVEGTYDYEAASALNIGIADGGDLTEYNSYTNSPQFLSHSQTQYAGTSKSKGRHSEYMPVSPQSPTLPPIGGTNNPFSEDVFNTVNSSATNSPRLTATKLGMSNDSARSSSSALTITAAADELQWPLIDDHSVTYSTTPSQNASPHSSRQTSQYSTSAHASLSATPSDGPSRSPSFGPGELHMNTVSRQVNAGFHVLPAGTFGALNPADDICRDDLEWPVRERRHSNRLQKRPPSGRNRDSRLSRAS